jgi:F-type H+-transporting ATPase subunit alpha
MFWLCLEHQVAILYATNNGYLDDVPVEQVGEWEAKFHDYMETQGREVLKAIRESKELNEETEKQLKEAISNFKQSQV